MVAWKSLLWPVLVIGSGFVWIFAAGVMSGFVPAINSFITSGDITVQTFNAVSFNLNFLSAAPGLVLILLGIGLIVDAVWHGRGDY